MTAFLIIFAHMILKNISSTQNSFIKELIQLQDKSRKRKKEGQFLIEGIREISLAIESTYEVSTILFNGSTFSFDQVQTLFNKAEITYIELSNSVYKKLAYRSTTEGVLALAKTKSHTLLDLKLEGVNPLVLVAEAPEKPGNIGAILRTADAAQVDAVIIANPKTDIYNPNIIRSSVGCVFTLPIALGSTSEIIAFLKKKGITCYSAALNEASEIYTEQDFTKASAIVVGTEATGLSEEWLASGDKRILIPMQGKIDSLNVSVSAGIIIFEAKRQRNFS